MCSKMKTNYRAGGKNLKKRTTLEKISAVTCFIVLLAIAVAAIIWKEQLTLVIVLSIIEYVLVQYLCYQTIYRSLEVNTARRQKLFLWGNILTLILAAIILIFASDNFRNFSAALIMILGYIAALIMREVEKTSPTNKKGKD